MDKSNEMQGMVSHPHAFTLEELRDFVEFLKSFLIDEGSFAHHVKKNPKFFEGLKESPSPPGFFYGFSFAEHVALFLILAGLTEGLKEIAEAENRVEKMRSVFDVDPPEWLVSGDDLERKGLFLCSFYTLMKNVFSIRTIGRPINELVELVASGQDTENRNLFDAVKLDRSVISTTAIATRIAIADMAQDKKFRARIANSMKRPFPKNRIEKYGMLRYVLSLMHEANMLSDMSEEYRYELFCKDLEIYPDRKGDSFEGLNRFIRRWETSIRT